ncbi:hypothetical protein H5410_058920 [Solanum commersonii]|uniref:Uncharacterized protein n=1 Tax=Solanum commersonii TaxID=4109 RepID=A0A9J5W145_SOLCO|nr:hypothetical protein H5410_058920 [Solanum commersonii]
MELVGPAGQTKPFLSSNEPQSRKKHILSIFMCYNSRIFGDSRFRNFFCGNFSWTSITALLKPLVGPEGQTNHFQVQISPKVEKTRFYLDILNIFCRIYSWTSVTTLLMEPVSPEGQIDPFSSSNDIQSRKN